jgi:hypothetical protein
MGDPSILRERAKTVSEFVQGLHPRGVILVSDGPYGQAVKTELSKTFAKRTLTVLNGESMKPDALVKSVERKLVRKA